MESFVSKTFESVIEAIVHLEAVERRIFSLQDKCDSIIAIRPASFFYSGGMFTGWRQNFYTTEQLDCLLTGLHNLTNLDSIRLEKDTTKRLFVSQWPESLRSVALGGYYPTVQLNSLPLLESLNLFWMGVDLSVHLPLANQLKALSIGSVINNSVVGEFSELQTLICGHWKDSVAPLSKLAKLERLFIENISAPLTGLQGGCESLRYLRLQTDTLDRLDGLGGLPSLRILEVVGGQHINSLEPLKGLNLESLLLPETSILDLSPLAELKKLRKLFLPKNLFTNIAPLADLQKLEILDLSECHDIESFYPLMECSNLKELKVSQRIMQRVPTPLQHLVIQEPPISSGLNDLLKSIAL